MGSRMRHLVALLVFGCAITFLSMVTGCAAGNSAQASGSGGSSSSSGSSPTPANVTSVYVYVSNPANNVIYAFQAAASGALTPVSGSPYTASGIGALATNNSWLFGVATKASEMVTYSISSSGGLTKVSSVTDANGPTSAFVDSYDEDVYTLGSANSNYDGFAVQQNGSLLSAGSAGGGPAVTAPQLAFTPNDTRAYGAGCSQGTPAVYGYTWVNTGKLTYFNANATLPAAPSGYQYCPEGAAVPCSCYVILPLERMTNNGATDTGSAQLAMFPIAADGTLTTSSTAANMPATDVGSVSPYPKFDPTNTYLAIPGSTGLQIFALSNDTLTSTGTVSITGGVNQVAWDNAGNLYALDWASGNLYVYHVTKGVPAAVSGSPYATGANSGTTPGLAVVVPSS